MINDFVKIDIPGKILSVKNMKMSPAGTNKVIDKPEAREWKKWLTDYLISEYGNIRFEEKVSIGYKFKMPGMSRQDCSNMIQGIEDCLQKAGIIRDDTWQLCSIAYAYGELAKSSKEVGAEVCIFED